MSHVLHVTSEDGNSVILSHNSFAGLVFPLQVRTIKISNKCVFHKPKTVPSSMFRGCFGYVLFEFIHNLVYFPSFKLGLDTSRHYWILFLHFHNFWAPSSQFQATDITFGWLLCLWRIHGLHHSLFDTKRRLYHGFSCHRRVSFFIKSNEFGPELILKNGIKLFRSNPEKLPFLFLVPHLAVSELHSVCNIGLSYSMLGFGDIIIPGFLGGYCAYFDLLNVHAHYYYWWTFIFSYGFG